MKNSTRVFCSIRCSLIVWASVGPGRCLILGRAPNASVSALSLSWSCGKEGTMYHRSERGGMKRDSRLPLLKDKYLRFGYLKLRAPLPRCESCRVPNIFARDTCLHQGSGNWDTEDSVKGMKLDFWHRRRGQSRRLVLGQMLQQATCTSIFLDVISDFVLTSCPEWECQDPKGHLIISLVCTAAAKPPFLYTLFRWIKLLSLLLLWCLTFPARNHCGEIPYVETEMQRWQEQNNNASHNNK